MKKEHREKLRKIMQTADRIQKGKHPVIPPPMAGDPWPTSLKWAWGGVDSWL